MWTDADRDLALAWLIVEESKCVLCGTVPDEWLTADDKLLVPPRYEADVHSCPGCREKARFERAHFRKDGPPAGMSVVLRRLTPEEQLHEYAAAMHNGPPKIAD